MNRPNGLDLFAEHFAGFTDQYVLIGGMANFLVMEENALDARATKDVDIVLLAEALTPEFGRAFWDFVERGGYEVRQRGEDKACFYRFSRPTDPAFPKMLELFSRVPDNMAFTYPGTVTPIPFDESVTSLSALLLDDDYYRLLHAGLKRDGNLSWIDETVLIPFKAKAWLDLRERQQKGEGIDSNNVKKHLNDVLRLSQVLPSSSLIPLPASILADMQTFLEIASGEPDPTLNLFGKRGPNLAQILSDLRSTFITKT
jgi:hypothetical protein